MRNKITKFFKNNSVEVLYITALLGFFFLPFLAEARDSVSQGLGQIQSEFPQSGLGRSRTITDFIASVIRIMLTIAGAIAVVFVIIGGFQYITSAGNAEAAEKGKATLINAIIGIIVVILSYVIINAVVGTVGCSGSLLCF